MGYNVVTPAQGKALATALRRGHVFIARGDRNRVDPNTECQRRTGEILAACGFLTLVPSTYESGHYAPAYYVLTEIGRKVALDLPDEYALASIAHKRETGRYLKYSDRPEFAPQSTQEADMARQFAAPAQIPVIDTASWRRSTPAPPPVPAERPLTVTEVLAKWDALKAEIKGEQDEYEDLSSRMDFKSAEQAQDMSDGWTQSEAEIARLFVIALRGEA